MTQLNLSEASKIRVPFQNKNETAEGFVKFNFAALKQNVKSAMMSF